MPPGAPEGRRRQAGDEFPSRKSRGRVRDGPAARTSLRHSPLRKSGPRRRRLHLRRPSRRGLQTNRMDPPPARHRIVPRPIRKARARANRPPAQPAHDPDNRPRPARRSPAKLRLSALRIGVVALQGVGGEARDHHNQESPSCGCDARSSCQFLHGEHHAGDGCIESGRHPGRAAGDDDRPPTRPPLSPRVSVRITPATTCTVALSRPIEAPQTRSAADSTTFQAAVFSVTRWPPQRPCQRSSAAAIT